MLEGLQRWAIRQALRPMRAAIARDPAPARIRSLLRRAAPVVARRERYAASTAFAVGEARGWWVQPDGGASSGSVVLYLHGGGFVAESRGIHDPLLAAICRAAGGRGLMVDYRLAPEHPFPAAVDDAFAAWHFLLSAGVDPGRIVIAGDSAGGNLALVTAMRARDEGLPQAAAMVLLSPVLDLTFSGDSVARNDGLDAMFRAASVVAVQAHYAPGTDLRDPMLSPLFGRLSGLPPAMVLVGSAELLLDDALRFAAKVPGVRLAVWHDVPHVFPAFRGLAAGDRAIAEIGEFIREKTEPATTGAG